MSRNGRVAVFDATNTTTARRQALCERARKEQVNLLFVESICDDKEILERNYHMKLHNDDYKDMDPQQVDALPGAHLLLIAYFEIHLLPLPLFMSLMYGFVRPWRTLLSVYRSTRKGTTQSKIMKMTARSATSS